MIWARTAIALSIFVGVSACDRSSNKTEASDPQQDSESLDQQSVVPFGDQILALVARLEHAQDKLSAQAAMDELAALLTDKGHAQDVEQLQLSQKDVLAKIGAAVTGLKSRYFSGGDVAADSPDRNLLGVIDAVIDVIVDLLNKIPYIVGGMDCGTLAVNNDNIGDHCAAVQAIATCIQNKCKAPKYKLVMCADDPTMPICGLKSQDACGIPAGACIPKGKSADDVMTAVIDEYLKGKKEGGEKAGGDGNAAPGAPGGGNGDAGAGLGDGGGPMIPGAP